MRLPQGSSNDSIKVVELRAPYEGRIAAVGPPATPTRTSTQRAVSGSAVVMEEAEAREEGAPVDEGVRQVV